MWPGDDKKLRFGWLDLLILAGLVLLFGWLAWRANTSLVYNWNWAIVPGLFFRTDAETGALIPHLLSQGLMVTLRLTFYASIAAAVVGLVIALCRIARPLLPRLIGRSYVELIRNVPPLVFIFVFYFFLSSQLMPILGIGDYARNLPVDQRWWFETLFGDRRLIEAFLSGVIVLAMFEGAYVAEIIRGGIQSIPKGQWEAASSLGLSRLDRMRFIVLPQAIRNTAPPLANQFISLVKDSSIVSLIAIQELTFMASQTVVTTQRTFEIWLTIGAIYFAICWPLSLCSGASSARPRHGSRRPLLHPERDLGRTDDQLAARQRPRRRAKDQQQLGKVLVRIEHDIVKLEELDQPAAGRARSLDDAVEHGSARAERAQDIDMGGADPPLEGQDEGQLADLVIVGPDVDVPAAQRHDG
jgi:polar amino acid transport system permease protein